MKHHDVMKHWNKNAPDWLESSRKGHDILRDQLNTPAFLNMLPNISQLNGLDVGCGDGHNSRLIAQQCKHLTAIDISSTFIRAANKESKVDNLIFKRANVVNLPFPDQQFDFATATMSLMDIAESEKVFSEIYRVLKPQAFFQFSIIHPCFNEHKGQWIKQPEKNGSGFLMRDYFQENQGEVHEWKHVGSGEKAKNFQVPRFSKPLSQWFHLILKTGFQIECVDEPYPDKDKVQAYPELKTACIVGHSMIFRVIKSESEAVFKGW